MKMREGTARQIPRKRVLYSLAAVVIVGVSAFAVVQSVGNASASSQHRPSARQIAQHILQQRLQYVSKHPMSAAQAQAARTKIAERIKAIEQEASQQPWSPLPSGISQGTRGGPFSACQFKLQSEYVSPPSGTPRKQLLAFAGLSVTPATCDPINGAVYLFQSDPASSPLLQDVGEFNAPTKAPLKIVSVKGEILNLQSLTGQNFTFNLTTHKYAS